MALRRCLGGCGRLINRGSYCRACEPRTGSTRAWCNVRAQVLYRDRWTGQLCGARADHVDHITPVLFGGTDDLGNLQSLCARHNLANGVE